jgi:hypothetical protein
VFCSALLDPSSSSVRAVSDNVARAHMIVCLFAFLCVCDCSRLQSTVCLSVSDRLT